MDGLPGAQIFERRADREGGGVSVGIGGDGSGEHGGVETESFVGKGIAGVPDEERVPEKSGNWSGERLEQAASALRLPFLAELPHPRSHRK